ncbi:MULTISPECIES: BON domain-containing protein [Cysteiniphilum]|uniref:BON domain-containing protein n=2 Tax=Cysteiniphilum TaxID=2056696 RepID=A0A8J2Z3F6_9GAMM|nr:MULTISPECIES: BON domain-containing protein [Cysteiniphilum]GGF94336.1 BON domain-containing protein [Cysteiniphilum litorale]
MNIIKHQKQQKQKKQKIQKKSKVARKASTNIKVISSLILGISLAGLLSACAPVVIAGAGAAVVGSNVAGSSVDGKTNASDKSIQFKAISLLNDYPALKGNSNVEPVVFNHIMLLLGQVPSEMLKTELANRMAKIPGVKVVYNQLTIGDPVDIGDYLSDSWITSKVISSMVSSGVNSLKFKVVTEKGVVYLMGVVTQSEGNQASSIAANVSGVKKVIEVYDYVSYPVEAPKVEQQRIE